MSFGATTLGNLRGFDDAQTPLASPSENRVLITQVQTGVDFIAP